MTTSCTTNSTSFGVATGTPLACRGRKVSAAALLLAMALSGCATTSRIPDIAYDTPRPAVLQTDPPGLVKIVEVPKVLPLPGQLKPVPDSKTTPEPADPTKRVSEANAAARIEPDRDGFINAIQVYPFTAGALYQIYAAPGEITDVALQPGEQLVGTGPVAAGDTVRWIIGNTTSGSGDTSQTHILIKPTRADLTTNLVINTDRRTYHVELRATDATYMASVSWAYPEDQLIALRQQNSQAQATQPVAGSIDLSLMNFRYAVEGDLVPWRPERAFDDGRQVFIQFPAGIVQGEMPPLFVLAAGNSTQLVNYRVRGNYMIVDRLFAAAELRLGSGSSVKRVRIVRTDGSTHHD